MRRFLKFGKLQQCVDIVGEVWGVLAEECIRSIAIDTHVRAVENQWWELSQITNGKR